MNNKNVSAVLLAGGSGQRFNGKKQFVELAGKPMWRHVYDTLTDIIPKERIICVGIDVPGGETRTMSVINGITALPDDTDRVLIVEAARPLVTVEQLSQLIEDAHPSVAFVMPLVNTVIMRSGQYLDRNQMYELLTPQAFDFKLLKAALNSGRFTDMTDDTRIMFEYHGIKPFFIQTGDNLIKITYPRDIYVVETLYKQLKRKD